MIATCTREARLDPARPELPIKVVAPPEERPTALPVDPLPYLRRKPPLAPTPNFLGVERVNEKPLHHNRNLSFVECT